MKKTIYEKNGFGKERLTDKEMDRHMNILSKLTVKCSCGHSVTITNKFKREICTWCGRYVYLDERDRFKNNLEKLMKKGE